MSYNKYLEQNVILTDDDMTNVIGRYFISLMVSKGSLEIGDLVTLKKVDYEKNIVSITNISSNKKVILDIEIFKRNFVYSNVSDSDLEVIIRDRTLYRILDV